MATKDHGKLPLAKPQTDNETYLKWQHLVVLTFVFAAFLSLLTSDAEGKLSVLSLMVTLIFSFGFAIFGLLTYHNRAKYAWMFILYTFFSMSLFRVRMTSGLMGHMAADERVGMYSEGAGYFMEPEAVVEFEEAVPHTVKIDAALKCLHQCREMPPGVDSGRFETDPVVLRKHYEELLELTEPFRPNKRAKRTVYRGYAGPRLEDHFIQHLIDEPFEETFAPIVPLFIHWTEVHFGRAGGGGRVLKEKLLKVLRKDVIYFTVTTDWSRGIQRSFQGHHIIFASSKGDKHAQIILPHLFYYNEAGFNDDGQPIWNLDEQQSLPAPEKVVKEDASWKFKGYDSYQTAPNLNLTSDMVPDHHRITFIGSLSTHAGRRKMHTMLGSKYKDQYYFGFFPLSKTCRDTSVESGASFCWRTFMLASDVNLCPAGTAPVSYRMYEALQMGAIPVYVHDYRGAFIPYAGTEADIRNGMGWAVSFTGLDDLMEKEISKLTEEEIATRHKKIIQFRETHFTPKGAIMQIKNW
eukprot:CAMPEP_0204838004 /NCGR_PEP_ID=MMETSP1346-20131115/29540_1 /ASSEMBLY_ACC=CAM_ASM_000771 /TAXON_ID=215587 /ORGANISM="Aplanochytrium stocchinoi, Strain GSBS06" /LENGTH=520 /DNA_ID=CAMNT_0051973773 /DNA_START=72 /DNA_END=1631 /DNA_ORIENTATION=-